MGTAVYQVGRAAPSQAKKRSALKPGAQTTLPPAATVASTAAIRPWMWNSGMTLRQRSWRSRASVVADVAGGGADVAMAERHDLGPGGPCRRCAAPGRRRSGWAGPGRAGVARRSECRRKSASRAVGPGLEFDQGEAEPAGDVADGGVVAGLHDDGAGLEVGQVELELVGAVGGVEGGGGRGAGDGEEGRGHLGPVGQHDGDGVAAADAEAVEVGDAAVDEGAQIGVGEVGPIGRADGRGGGVGGVEQVADAVGHGVSVLGRRAGGA